MGVAKLVLILIVFAGTQICFIYELSLHILFVMKVKREFSSLS